MFQIEKNHTIAQSEIDLYFHWKSFNGFDNNGLYQNEHYHIIWIQEGEGKLLLDTQTLDVKDDMLLFLSQTQIIAARQNLRLKGISLAFNHTFYCIELHDKDVSCNGVLFNNVYDVPYFCLNPAEKQFVVQIHQQIEEELQQKQSAQLDMLRTLVKQLIIRCTRILKTNYCSIYQADNEHIEFKRNFSTLVEKNFREIHSVKEYADLLYLAPKSLTQKLKAAGEDSPLDIITNRIVLEAKRLLLYSDKSIKEIAFDLGFSDPFYFTRLFTKTAGLAPSNFRKAFFNVG